MRRFVFFLAACLFLLAGYASAQVKDSDLKAYLAGVTHRGRALYAYDQAAWHGTDAIFALQPDTSGLTHYICARTSSGWQVTFLKWDEAHEKLLVAYQANEVKGGKYEARKIDPPVEASSELASMERALVLALADFPRPDRPYNTAILPGPDGNFYVYLYPGQTNAKVWPLGGDVRYLVSSDGMKILEKRQMHKDILDTENKTGAAAVGGYHTHVLTDVPEDTDVLYVLTRQPSVPEYVSAGKRLFEIFTDGTITLAKRKSD